MNEKNLHEVTGCWTVKLASDDPGKAPAYFLRKEKFTEFINGLAPVEISGIETKEYSVAREINTVEVSNKFTLNNLREIATEHALDSLFAWCDRLEELNNELKMYYNKERLSEEILGGEKEGE